MSHDLAQIAPIRPGNDADPPDSPWNWAKPAAAGSGRHERHTSDDSDRRGSPRNPNVPCRQPVCRTATRSSNATAPPTCSGLMATKFPDLAIVDLGLPDRDGLELATPREGSDRLAGRIDPELPLRALRPGRRARPPARIDPRMRRLHHQAVQLSRAARARGSAAAAQPALAPVRARAGGAARARPDRAAGVDRRNAGGAVQQGVERAAASAGDRPRRECSRARSCCTCRLGLQDARGDSHIGLARVSSAQQAARLGGQAHSQRVGSGLPLVDGGLE